MLKKTKIYSGNRIKFIILEISCDQINKTKRKSWSCCWLVKRRVLDPFLQFIPTDILQKKFAFFDHVQNSHRTDIFYHCDSCCHKVDLRGIEILKMQQAYVPDSRFQFWIRDYSVSLYLSHFIFRVGKHLMPHMLTNARIT